MGNCVGLPNKIKIYTEDLNSPIKDDIPSEYSDNNKLCVYTSKGTLNIYYKNGIRYHYYNEED
jgi:hypothetical protein